MSSILVKFMGSFLLLMLSLQPSFSIESNSTVRPTIALEKEYKKALVDDLYNQLKEAADSKSANTIANKISNYWFNNGSDTSKILMNNAKELLQSSQIAQALKIYNTVIDNEPDYLYAHSHRAIIYFMINHYAEAINDLKFVVDHDPNYFDALLGLATCYQKLGYDEMALITYKKIIAIYPLYVNVRDEMNKLEEKLHKESI